MRKTPVTVLAVAAAVLLAGCGGRGPGAEGGPGGRHEEEWHAPVQILLRYDANHDGSVTRAEMEAGLRADFAAADTNHDGVITLAELDAYIADRVKELTDGKQHPVTCRPSTIRSSLPVGVAP